MWVYVLLSLSVFLKDASFAQDTDDACVKVADMFDRPILPKVIYVVTDGFLYSPGFLNNANYPDGVICSYQLQTKVGYRIRLHFNFLDLDTTDHCSADNLRIYDFDSSGRGVIKKVLCGDQKPYDYVSDSHALQIVFQTDDFAGKRGFNISYLPQISPSVCNRGQIQCRNRNCVDEEKVCNGIDDCGDGTDEEKCPGVPLEPEDCGRPSFDPATSTTFDRIVGGKEAVVGSWPWMADLQIGTIEPNGHVCGGALINAQWVLSAAHCFTQEGTRTPSAWRIHLGNHHKFERDEHEQIRYVERFIIFQDIPPSVFEQNGEFDIVHDMALIKLNAPVQFTKYVKPVCLPDYSFKPNITTNCYATGWGATRGTGSSNVLKQANHPVQADVMCRRLVGNQFVSETMICAGSLAPLNGVCHGDSGGPLVCETQRGVWSLAGVASYVTDGTGTEGLCGLKSRPSVFNKVTAKVGWIKWIINRYG